MTQLTKNCILGIALFSMLLLPVIGLKAQEASFELHAPGTQFPVDYTAFGEFYDVNTENFFYNTLDPVGLKAAVGEGIYPNTTSIYADPGYQQYLSEGKLGGSHWDFINTDDPQADFYKWATAPEEPGVKLFFTAQALINAGHIEHAIKAFHAIIIHYQKSPCYDPWGDFYWYVGPSSVSMIDTLCRDYPELEVKLTTAKVRIQNGSDLDLSNDIAVTDPGSFISYTHADRLAAVSDPSTLTIAEQRGTGKVQVVKYSSGHWQLIVDGKPFIIKGMTYGPTQVGMGSQEQGEWISLDSNNNDKIDAPYDSWVDRNNNNIQDFNEPTVGDFQLLKELGCNSIRLFHSAGDDNITYDPGELDKTILRDLYNTYGIRVILGDFLGAYTIGSGADWSVGTDYTDPQQRENMKNVVRDLVLDHKDEPYVLLWLLGNENNMESEYGGVNATRTNAAVYPQEYAEFLNEVAAMIHAIDPDHPVALGNLGTGLLEYYGDYAQEIDILATNWYTGKYGIGFSYLDEIKEKFDRPVFLPEYGCDAYHYEQGENQAEQAAHHKGCWRAIMYNTAHNPAIGNMLGAMVFEWLDEWWKDTQSGDSVYSHQTEPQFHWGILPDGWSHEEWFGICSQGNGSNSPFLRQLREAYYVYKSLWSPPLTKYGHNIILSWNSYPGITYDIYYSDDGSTWHLAQSEIPASGISTTTWPDNGEYTGTHPKNVSIRYYRVAVHGKSPALYVLQENTGSDAEGTISGTVTLQSRTDHSATLTFELREPGETTSLYTYEVNTSTNGSFSLEDIPSGTYDLTVKNFNSLRAKQTNIIINEGETTANINFYLFGGDANNDNYVSWYDFGILRNSYRSSTGHPRWDARADFNNDGYVSWYDFGILRSNYRRQGAE
ncbi:MAG: hypothetical protein GY853_06185 [PVC group bacterium]|nr:hypothetical protein [PVC group bacterium]